MSSIGEIAKVSSIDPDVTIRYRIDLGSRQSTHAARSRSWSVARLLRNDEADPFLFLSRHIHVDEGAQRSA